MSDDSDGRKPGWLSSEPSTEPTEHGHKLSFSTPYDVEHGENYWTDPSPAYEAKADAQDPPARTPPSREEISCLVEYRCGSCKKWCLVDHATDAAKYRECRDCVRVPELGREIKDHRATSLLWAHQLTSEGSPAWVCPPSPSPRERRGHKRDRAATQRTRPGMAEQSEATRPVSRTVAARDSGEEGKPPRRQVDSIRADGGQRD